ncbi:DUF4421 family protein [Salibacter halophilus]|uniref:DUF4421 domain-containing protein n=1 Tax=Salibacter halophilus TaxID=1803916 RepID=A0A6N6M8M3_9FLAO|nr:DUF4421 family protein [Salibacter halophilus]KAB1065104.1 DUF4421 domain-containing protein [Salibacter halophilus]
MILSTKNIFSFILAIFPLATYAQLNDQSLYEKSVLWVEENLNYYDSNYVEKFPFKYMVGTRLSRWDNAYDLEFGDNEALNLRSEAFHSVGVSLGYKLISFNYNINFSRFDSQNDLSDNQFNVMLNTSRLVGEFSYSINEGGVTVETYRKEVEGEEQSIDIDKSFDGLRNQSFSLDLHYFFNGKKYSNAAAYSVSYINKQVQNAGSFIAGVSFSGQATYIDFQKLVEETGVESFPNRDELNVNYRTLAINFGYGYSFVFFENWLLNATAIPTAGIKFYEQEENEANGRFALGGKSRLSVVYNRENHFISLNYNNFSEVYFSEDYRLTNTLGTLSLSGGIKF